MDSQFGTTTGNGSHGAIPDCAPPRSADPDELFDLYRFAPVGLVLFSLDYRYLRINDRMAEFNGVTNADHIGHSIFEIVPDVADLTKTLIDRVAATAVPLPRHVIERTNPVTGQLSVYGVHWYPVFNADGAVQAVCAIPSPMSSPWSIKPRAAHIARRALYPP